MKIKGRSLQTLVLSNSVRRALKMSAAESPTGESMSEIADRVLAGYFKIQTAPRNDDELSLPDLDNEVKDGRFKQWSQEDLDRFEHIAKMMKEKEYTLQMVANGYGDEYVVGFTQWLGETGEVLKEGKVV